MNGFESEQFTDELYDARKADIWSIGIIYYAMIFHGIPWETAACQDSNYRHYIRCAGKGFEPFSRLSSGPKRMLKRMLEPNPMKRITIEEILNDEWYNRIRVVPLFTESSKEYRSVD